MDWFDNSARPWVALLYWRLTVNLFLAYTLIGVEFLFACKLAFLGIYRLDSLEFNRTAQGFGLITVGHILSFHCGINLWRLLQ